MTSGSQKIYLRGQLRTWQSSKQRTGKPQVTVEQALPLYTKEYKPRIWIMVSRRAFY